MCYLKRFTRKQTSLNVRRYSEIIWPLHLAGQHVEEGWGRYEGGGGQAEQAVKSIPTAKCKTWNKSFFPCEKFVMLIDAGDLFSAPPPSVPYKHDSGIVCRRKVKNIKLLANEFCKFCTYYDLSWKLDCLSGGVLFQEVSKATLWSNIQTEIYNIFFDVSKLTKSGLKKANQSSE